MPPQLAALVYLSVVVWLLRRDFRERPNVTGALWLPFCWVLLGGTRFVSGWLRLCGFHVGAVSLEEGSPIDALVFFILLVSGIYVLHQRRVNVAEFMRQNRWVTIYLCYCLLACAWSDFSFVAFKRWLKLLGQPVMVLIMLTEPDPLESFIRLLKRFAYIVIPISMLFIKYFPQWGSAYDPWNGHRMNTGITTDKNALGCDCFILGLFLIWNFLRVWRQEKSKFRRNELILCGIFLGLAGWLLHMAQSSTSVGALALAVVVMFILGLKFVDRRRLGSYLVAGAVIGFLLEVFFGIHNYIIVALGRDPTLTGRTEIWQILLHWDINPLLGDGFESFWLTDHMKKMSELVPGAIINEAHNGYLETYLNLGLLGVFITLAMLLAAYFKSQRTLLQNFDFGRFRLSYLAAFILYNWTEAAFRMQSLPFFIFFLIAIDYPAATSLPVSSGLDPIEADAHVRLGATQENGQVV